MFRWENWSLAAKPPVNSAIGARRVERALVLRSSPDDNRVLECVVAGRAKCIVSGDWAYDKNERCLLFFKGGEVLNSPRRIPHFLESGDLFRGLFRGLDPFFHGTNRHV